MPHLFSHEQPRLWNPMGGGSQLDLVPWQKRENLFRSPEEAAADRPPPPPLPPAPPPVYQDEGGPGGDAAGPGGYGPDQAGATNDPVEFAKSIAFALSLANPLTAIPTMIEMVAKNQVPQSRVIDKLAGLMGYTDPDVAAIDAMANSPFGFAPVGMTDPGYGYGDVGPAGFGPGSGVGGFAGGMGSDPGGIGTDAGDFGDPEGATGSYGGNTGDVGSGQGGASGSGGVGDESDGGDGGGGEASVICTVLHANGFLHPGIYEAETRAGRALGADVMRGYHLWGKPWARLLTRFPALCGPTYVLLIPYILQIISGDHGFVIRNGARVCRALGRWTSPDRTRVSGHVDAYLGRCRAVARSGMRKIAALRRRGCDVPRVPRGADATLAHYEGFRAADAGYPGGGDGYGLARLSRRSGMPYRDLFRRWSGRLGRHGPRRDRGVGAG